ncbi:MAG: hypothetical protein FWB80_14330 [Defluviitaleaceae bacterium]|nr:hypothetical protein [Defluviitaleaceae bacterium]
MSTHGEIILKPINEVAAYKKNLLPPNIPEKYPLKPEITDIADEEKIRKGVIAFKDFLHTFFGHLITDGHMYAKPTKKPTGMSDYPFLNYITNLLVDIGYHGKLSENGDALLISDIPKNPKIPASAKNECLKFLTLCGFVFTEQEATYPNNPLLLTGLKAMATADMELRTERRYWNDHNLLRCDYRLIKSDPTDILDILKDFIHPLPQKIQSFALKLHQRYTAMGLTCILTKLGDDSLFYVKKPKNVPPRDMYAQRIWEFSYSLRHGYCIFVRAKKTKKYAEIIEKFPAYLKEKIEKGYGCDRKLRNEPCRHGCQGIRLPLDETILTISEEIKTWLDNEILK